MTFFNVPQPWGYHYYYFFFSSCQNVNFNEKYLQTGLPLGGMSLQAKSGLDESEVLMGLFSHAYRCLGHTDVHLLLSLQAGMLCSIHTQLSHKGAHISSLPYTSLLSALYLQVTCSLLLPWTHTFILLYLRPGVFYPDTQNCVRLGRICKPVPQQHTVHALTCPHRPPFHRYPRSRTLNTAPSPTIPDSPLRKCF